MVLGCARCSPLQHPLGTFGPLNNAVKYAIRNSNLNFGGSVINMHTLALSTTQRLSLSGVTSYQKPCRAANACSSSFHLQNSSWILIPSFSFTISKFKPLQVIPASSSSLAAEATQESTRTLTLRELCHGHVPDHILRRMDELGYVLPTDVQMQALPILFSGHDCILHAQTGSGKTLAYLLLIHAVVSAKRSSVQALIVVPTRELGIQVTKVARVLAAKPEESVSEQKPCTVMALLDGGMLKRHKSWLKAEPPTIVVATVASLCRMVDKKIFPLNSVRVLVIDEVDFIFNSSKLVSYLKKILQSYSSCDSRQTIFASASIPQHRRFVHDCIQQKWTKNDVIHIHVSPMEAMPIRLQHRFVVSCKSKKHETLLSLIHSDVPESGIIFVSEQSEKSKKAGDDPATTFLFDFLKTSYKGSLEIIIMEEEMNFNSRAASLLCQPCLQEVRQGSSFLLVATDIAARGVDLPQTSHIYNFDLPKTAIDYIHRAGRTCRRPFSDERCLVTNILVPEERFVLERYENELKFTCEELSL